MTNGLQQIAGVEAHRNVTPLSLNVQPLLGLFLLRVLAIEDHGILLRLDLEADALLLFNGEHRDSAQCALEQFLVDLVDARQIARHHALIIGEATFDQFGGEADRPQIDPHRVRRNLDRDGVVRIAQQARQFLDALARHDDLAIAGEGGGQRFLKQREAMTVGSHRAEGAALQIQQQPVQVIAHILLGHGEEGLVESQPQEFTRYGSFEVGGAGIEGRVVLHRQCGQIKAAAATADRHAVFLQFDIDLATIRQQAQDVQELAGRYRHRAGFPRLDADARHQLNFQVGARQ